MCQRREASCGAESNHPQARFLSGFWGRCKRFDTLSGWGMSDTAKLVALKAGDVGSAASPEPLLLFGQDLEGQELRDLGRREIVVRHQHKAPIAVGQTWPP